MSDDLRAQLFVALLGDRLVDLPPPDLVAARLLLDDELVVGRSACVRRGDRAERTAGRERAFAAPDRFLDERSAREVPVRRPAGLGDAVLIETVTARGRLRQ